MQPFIGPIKPGHRPTQAEPPSSSSSVSQATNCDTKGEIGKIRKQKYLRVAGGSTWEDPTLDEWDPKDYRVFCGDLGNDITDELLTKTFERYESFVKAKVVREKRTGKSRGYAFISFKDPLDYAKAIKEWDGKYLGSRPIKMRKSIWRDRNIEVKKTKMPQTVNNLIQDKTS